MTLPSAATKVYLDSASDDPKQARAELASLIDKFNDLLTHLNASPITSTPLAVGSGLSTSGGNLIAPETQSVGDYKFSAQSSNHGKWLKCDGTAVSRTTYSALFAIIGVGFGSGDGSTTFNLPDLRGRIPGGIGQGSGLTNRASGASVGAENHTLTQSEMPSHTHSVTDPGHSHTWDAWVQSGASGAGLSVASGNSNISVTDNGVINSATTGISLGNTGSGSAHNNMQPTLFVGNFFIYTGV